MSMETVEYGVEVRDDHPRSQWRYRYGWYGEGDGGEDRMRRTLELARASGDYFDCRLVRRRIAIDVVEPGRTPGPDAPLLYEGDQA